ncbi:tissue factor pathway inhibitor [Carlito syrichta]|uniref:Tissue factor pathway inhibitor n=1 Tax=Carlito syrichta TaxID=1868482 RepID=A0A3Q0DE44_CARSF|nr:tissue factor pathway inhibitor [Carlito syrichta]
MKKERVVWTSVCLLLSLASALNAGHEEDEEYISFTDIELPSTKPLHSFCGMKADDGPCKAMMRRFFFNIYSQQCEEFIYGGCEGNQNRFDSLEECEKTCIGDYPEKFTKAMLSKGKPDFCFLEEDPGICRGYFSRYFYNNQSQKCEEFKYGGCLGNRNNFESLKVCKIICENAWNDSQVNDYKTQSNVVNIVLIPKPTKDSRIFVTKEGTNDGWKNADHIYQVFLNAFCLHASMFFLGFDSILCVC